MPATFEELIKLILDAESTDEKLVGALGTKEECTALVNQHDESKKWTLLHYAADAGRVGFCRLLVEKGAKPGVRDARGQNAAHVAFAKSETECASTILDAIGEIRGPPSNYKSEAWYF